MVSKIVVSTVEQKIQNGQDPAFLKHLLADPAAISQKDRQQLETLVETYPQCSIFHLLLAKAVQSDPSLAAKTLQSAAVYAANREVLFRLIHRPEQIIAPKREKIYPFVQPFIAAETLNPNASFTPEILVKVEAEFALPDKNAFAESYPVVIINTAFKDEKVVPVKEEPILLEESYPEENCSIESVDASFTNEKLAEEPSVEIENDEPIDLNFEEAITAENDLRVEDVDLNFINEPVEDVVFPAEEEAKLPQQTEEISAIQTRPEEKTDSLSGEIDEEVYNEITAIEDIRFDVVKTASPEETKIAAESEKVVGEISTLNVQYKAEKDMLSSIASIDYFTFNNKFGLKQTGQQLVAAVKTSVGAEAISVKTEAASAEKEPETVSKYHDDKMPYTFMWWLDKTRKEYSGTYQPYVKDLPAQKNELDVRVGPELNQQYIESIFRAQPVHELTEKNLPPVVQPQIPRKEDRLIERFIIEEPHIHPPSNDKLDTENKAKKSSEDADVLVTETLAKIYLDQMLYHKAIDTYKKLMSKFPEKSSYFAAQISLIEKK